MAHKYINVTPMIGSYYDYINVNTDPYLRKNMVHYFRKEVINWLINDLKVSKCFKVSGNKVIKNGCKNKNNQKDKEIIAKYIYDQYIYPNRLIKEVLFKFTKIRGVNWYDLKYHCDDLKHIIDKKIKNKI